MARARLTVRRLLGTPTFVSAPGQGNKWITRQRNREFKIKKLLPQAKAIQVKKNGQVITTMRAMQKTIHFSGNRTLRI